MSSRYPKARKVYEVLEGEYRVFHTFYKNGEKATLGIPKDNCRDKRVWAGHNHQEVARLSESDARESYRALASGTSLMRLGGSTFGPKLLSSGTVKGGCPECGGRLQIKSGRYGDFYGCSNFPSCKHTEDA